MRTVANCDEAARITGLVDIYHDPYTETDFEGSARVVEVVNVDRGAVNGKPGAWIGADVVFQAPDAQAQREEPRVYRRFGVVYAEAS